MSKINRENFNEVLNKAAEVIRNGGLVVFPTETVYGLGANALDEEAVKKIFKAKGRPSDNPIIVHIGDRKDLEKIAEISSKIEEKLISVFWPGPLTLILKKKDIVPKEISGGLETVAVRMPSNDIARELVMRSQVPIAAPSANISGTPSGTKYEHIFDDLKDRVDMIIEAEPSEIGIESTVVKVLDNKILILRAGAITKEILEENFPEAEIAFATESKDLNASPGTRYKHYAPQVKLEIQDYPDIYKRAQELTSQGLRPGIICSEETKDDFSLEGNIFIVGNRDDLKEISKNLYDALRFFKKENTDIILCEAFPEKGLGTAIMDRLKKASREF